MQALIYHGPESLRFEECAEPSYDKDKGEVLIAIKAVSICGSDMHAYFGHDERRPAPLILGHEAAGVIVGSADEADIGVTVAVNPLVTCGVCSACTQGRDNLCDKRQIISMPPRQGAFCQYLAMPRQNLVVVADGFSLAKASLCEPIACGRHAVNLARQAFIGDAHKADCLIFGGGAIGLAIAINLHYFEMRHISVIEPNPKRAEFIKQNYDFEVVTEIGNKQYDIIFDAYGGQPSRLAASAGIKAGGVIILSGLADNEAGFDFRRQTLQEITTIGAYTYSAIEYRQTAQDMFAGKLAELVPDTWQDIRALSEGVQAFQDIVGQKIAAPKITLIP